MNISNEVVLTEKTKNPEQINLHENEHILYADLLNNNQLCTENGLKENEENQTDTLTSVAKSDDMHVPLPKSSNQEKALVPDNHEIDNDHVGSAENIDVNIEEKISTSENDQVETTNGHVTAIESDKINNFAVHSFPSVVERYFTKRYEVNMPKGHAEYEKSKISNWNDVCILRHSNKLCIVTLAPSHPVIKNKATISVSEVSFKVSDRLDHSLNRVSGKRKRGAHWLNGTTPICIITCNDGSKYTIHAGTRGSLVEINDKLQTEPLLLQQAYETNGYIAIIMPKLTEGSKALDDLLTEEQYQDYLSSMSANMS